jgi:hypothetical protein
MSVLATYRRYVYQLTAGVDFLRDGLGKLYAGTYGAVADGLLEGVRQAFVQSLPGHPEQTADSLDQVGADRQLFKYRGESIASWGARVQNAWQYYEQAGTDVQVKRAINEWGPIVFNAVWNPALVFLTEGPWAEFAVWLGAGVTPWQVAATYDSGVTYDSGALYDISNATTEDVFTLSRIIKKWKPERSRAKVIIVLAGIAYDEPGVAYDSGYVYGTSTSVVVVDA